MWESSNYEGLVLQYSPHASLTQEHSSKTQTGLFCSYLRWSISIILTCSSMGKVQILPTINLRFKTRDKCILTVLNVFDVSVQKHEKVSGALLWLCEGVVVYTVIPAFNMLSWQLKVCSCVLISCFFLKKQNIKSCRYIFCDIIWLGSMKSAITFK